MRVLAACTPPGAETGDGDASRTPPRAQPPLSECERRRPYIAPRNGARWSSSLSLANGRRSSLSLSRLRAAPPSQLVDGSPPLRDLVRVARPPASLLSARGALRRRRTATSTSRSRRWAASSRCGTPHSARDGGCVQRLDARARRPRVLTVAAGPTAARRRLPCSTRLGRPATRGSRCAARRGASCCGAPTPTLCTRRRRSRSSARGGATISNSRSSAKRRARSPPCGRHARPRRARGDGRADDADDADRRPSARRRSWRGRARANLARLRRPRVPSVRAAAAAAISIRSSSARATITAQLRVWVGAPRRRRGA